MNHTIVPTDCDVLSGRGTGPNTWHGNKEFRQIVNNHKPLYKNQDKREKSSVAKMVISAIRQNGGRFLTRDPATGGWIEMAAGSVLAKVMQALREENTAASRVRKRTQQAMRQQRLANPTAGLAPPSAGNVCSPALIPIRPRPAAVAAASRAVDADPIPVVPALRVAYLTQEEFNLLMQHRRQKHQDLAGTGMPTGPEESEMPPPLDPAFPEDALYPESSIISEQPIPTIEDDFDEADCFLRRVDRVDWHVRVNEKSGEAEDVPGPPPKEDNVHMMHVEGQGGWQSDFSVFTASFMNESV